MAPSTYTSSDAKREETNIHKSDFYAGNKYPTEEKRAPIVVWLPPRGTDYITTHGRWTFGIPVWDQASAKVALDNFKRTMEECIYEDKYSNTVNLERLFLLADSLVPALELMKQMNEIL